MIMETFPRIPPKTFHDHESPGSEALSVYVAHDEKQRSEHGGEIPDAVPGQYLR
jgi:hypothetical protein